MFKIKCDDIVLYDPRFDDLAVIDPTLELELNQPGSLTFKLPPDHPYYETPQKMKSIISVFQDKTEMFRGRIIEEKIDFYKRKQLVCEGQLAFLNDTLQRPAEYHDMTVRGYFEQLINSHNKQVSGNKYKTFKVGAVTVTDSNDSLYRYTNYNSTFSEIKSDLIDDLGGYLKIRNEEEGAYLDYLKDSGDLSSQTIEFGENLLDYTHDMDLSDLITAIVPLGAKLEESPIAALEQRLTIESVNDGSDVLISKDAVEQFGYIEGTITWDGINTPEYLLKKAKKYLEDYQFDSVSLEITAVDLHWTDSQISAFKLGDSIRVISKPHGMDRWFPLTKMTLNLANLANTKFTLGTSADYSLTTTSRGISSGLTTATETIPSTSKILKEAKDNASALIASATTGYVVTRPNELLVMNTDSVDTATKVWRMNVNGFGYSNNGYGGPYDVAITMDGTILGERLVGGSVDAEKINIRYTEQVLGEASDSVDEKLQSYYTSEVVDVKLKTTNNSISAEVTRAKNAEENLSSKINLNDSAITAEVTRAKNAEATLQSSISVNATNIASKVAKGDFASYVTQYYDRVITAFNGSSKYVQLSAGAISIYDSAVENSKLRSLFNQHGNWFYRDGYCVGLIGTNSLDTDTSKRGLVFDLKKNASYMSWGYQTEEGKSYDLKLLYTSNGAIKGTDSDTLNAYCDFNMHGYALKNLSLKDVSFEGGGITGTLKFVQIREMDSSQDGTVQSWTNGAYLTFKNGILTGGSWYG